MTRIKELEADLYTLRRQLAAEQDYEQSILLRGDLAAVSAQLDAAKEAAGRFVLYRGDGAKELSRHATLGDAQLAGLRLWNEDESIEEGELSITTPEGAQWIAYLLRDELHWDDGGC